MDLQRPALLLSMLLLSACAGLGGADGDEDCVEPDPDAIAEGTFSGSNEPPTAPEVRISPEIVSSADPFHCLIWTPSEDPDGDEVYYRFQWLVDGKDAGITASAMHGWEAVGDSTWTCIATPSDGKEDGPSGQAEITIAFTGPHVKIIPPVVKILPEEPTAEDDLQCVIIEAAFNPEGGQITYLFTWRLNGQNHLIDVSDVAASETSIDDEWTCSVTPMVLPCDGGCQGEPGEDSVVILNPG